MAEDEKGDRRDDKKPSLEKKYELVPGVVFGNTIVVHPQYEFDCRRLALSNEADLAKVRNGLFDLINWLAALLITHAPDRKSEVETALGALDTDQYSPKTQIQMNQGQMTLLYDSVPATCRPEQLPVVLEQINRERIEVTVRQLWGVVRGLQIVAHQTDLFRKQYEVSRDARDAITKGMRT